MVRLQEGQKVTTEWNGLWLLAKVDRVDASLVRMLFEVDGRRWPEWIYRGSTRLEPLFKEMVRKNDELSLNYYCKVHHTVHTAFRYVLRILLSCFVMLLCHAPAGTARKIQAAWTWPQSTSLRRQEGSARGGIPERHR